jgi:hypothetical protein
MLLREQRWRYHGNGKRTLFAQTPSIGAEPNIKFRRTGYEPAPGQCLHTSHQPSGGGQRTTFYLVPIHVSQLQQGTCHARIACSRGAKLCQRYEFKLMPVIAQN